MDRKNDLLEKIEETTAYICDDLCWHRREVKEQKKLDAICAECRLGDYVCWILNHAEKKGNEIVESLKQVDFSGLGFPLVTIYEKPSDFPGAFVARVWEGNGVRPTNVMIKRYSLQEIREDITAAGFCTRFDRAEGDEPHIVETWIR